MRYFRTVLYVLPLMLLLSACSERNMADLEVFVATVKRKPSPPLKELPQFPTEENYQYQAIKDKKVDPFISFEQTTDVREEEDTEEEETLDCPRPDKYRSKQQLEYFPRDALLMVGSLEQSGQVWGLILDPDGNVYRVQENDYLGKRYGRIISIDENHIELRELHQDKRGCYEEVPASIMLTVVD